jgi:cell wall-associated NlpC family hydrolase
MQPRSHPLDLDLEPMGGEFAKVAALVVLAGTLALLLALALPLALVGLLLPGLPSQTQPVRPAASVVDATVSSPNAVDVPDSLAGGAVDVARRYLGVPYVFGGTNPAVGLDCSGLVQLVFRQLGMVLPRTAQQQYNATVRVSRDQLQPGDLVFFARTYADPNDWITHVGIYAGDGQQINAPTSGQVVSIQSVFSGFWGAHYAGGGRVARP